MPYDFTKYFSCMENLHNSWWVVLVNRWFHEKFQFWLISTHTDTIFVDFTRNNSQGECWNWCLCIQRNVCIKIREFINFQRTKQRLIPLVPMAEVMNENKVNLLVYFYSLLLLLSWLVKPYPTHAKVLLRWVFGKRLCPSILLSWAG